MSGATYDNGMYDMMTPYPTSPHLADKDTLVVAGHYNLGQVIRHAHIIV